MKILSLVDTLQTQQSTTARAAKSVCMHVLGEARTDERVMREATALVEAGFEVSIIDIESQRSRHIKEVVRGVCLDHLVMPSWFVPARFKPWFLIKMAWMFIHSTIKLMRTPADIYHAHEEMALPACYIAARYYRKPLIFDSHELPLSEPHITRWRQLCILSSRILKLIVPRCSGVITVSPPIAQELCQRYQASAVQLVRNVPVYRTVTKNDRLRQHLGLCPETRIALYQGNIQPDRGLDRLVYAAAHLEPKTVIVIMGKGSEETQRQLKTIIHSEGVADRVKLLPPVPYKELLDWTASADIGLIVYSPSHSQNVQMCLPNKLFEYMMAGLPVLVSSLDVVSDVIRTYGIGKVANSLLPVDIAHDINTMLSDKQALACMQHNAIEAAQNEFCWEKESLQLVTLYRRILQHVE